MDKEKMILNKMIEYFADELGSDFCPQEMEYDGFSYDCENKCVDNYSKCWTEYFREKAENEIRMKVIPLKRSGE